MRIAMDELYVTSLTGGKKVWMGVKDDGERDVKPKLEPKNEAEDQEHHQSTIDNEHQLPIPPPNAPFSRPGNSVSIGVSLSTTSPNLPTLSTVSVTAEGQGTINKGDSMMVAVAADKDKEKRVTDELQKWKEDEANKRESQLKDRLLESKEELIAMMKKYGELEMKLKQREETIASMEKRGVGVATMESAVQTDSVESAKETLPTEQQSRAARAAQLLGVPLDIVEPPNEWKNKCEELERTLETMKRFYCERQKMTDALRGEPIDMGREVKKEVVEEAIILLDDDESNEMVTSSPDPIQLEGRKRPQKQQLERMRKGNATAINGDTLRADSGENERPEESDGGRRMVVRNRRLLPAVAPKKQSVAGGTANPTNVTDFPCAQCPNHLHFVSAQLLQQHIDRRHSDRQRFPCDQCAVSFTHRSSLNVHKKRVHSGGVKAFACAFCSMRFVRKSDMNKHERVHTGERPFVCATCQKTFKRSSELRRHERIHSGEKRYCCQFCGNRFTQSGDCWTHQKSCSQRPE